MEPIQFVDLKKQAQRIDAQIKQALNKVIANAGFIMGPELYQLENELSAFTGARHVISCASGTDALLMILMARGIGPGDAVFTTPFTFIATAEVISLLGATPVFVDVDEATFNMDPEKLKYTLEAFDNGLDPKCIIPVDIFGLPADYESINKIAQGYGLFVIEDAAQSFGAKSGSQMACNLTDAATTSFFPAKPLGCYGDGGAIFTNDEDLKDKLVSIRVHGKGSDKYDNTRIGMNGRLDTLQAAVLLQKLKIFKEELIQREINSQLYKDKLNNQLQYQEIPNGCLSAWAQFSFISDRRKRIMETLTENKVPHMIYYPKPLHLQRAFASLNYKKGDFPVAEKICETILSIPVHPYLSDEQIDYIVLSINKALD